MTRWCDDIDPLDDLKVTVGFVQVADFDDRGVVYHVWQLFLSCGMQ